MSDLRSRLRALGLLAASAALDDLVALATKKRWGITEILEHVADLEEKDRSRRGLERRMSRSRLEKFKPMADFDWNWPTAIDRPLVESLLSLDFVGAPRNAVLVAPAGLGKTMIAKNIAHRAVLAGRSVLFLSAAQMLLDLGAQESARALERRLQYYAKVGLLVVDELGFLAFDNRNADLIFQVVSRRYEKKSLILTTNLAFTDWHTVFPSATCATAPSNASSITPTSLRSRARAIDCANRSRTPTHEASHAATRSPRPTTNESVRRNACSNERTDASCGCAPTLDSHRHGSRFDRQDERCELCLPKLTRSRASKVKLRRVLGTLAHLAGVALHDWKRMHVIESLEVNVDDSIVARTPQLPRAGDAIIVSRMLDDGPTTPFERASNLLEVPFSHNDANASTRSQSPASRGHSRTARRCLPLPGRSNSRGSSRSSTVGPSPVLTSSSPGLFGSGGSRSGTWRKN
jgi:DNA replication protein DnaC